MVEVDYGGRNQEWRQRAYMCGLHITHSCGGPSSDTVSCISLCKKTITVTSLDNVSGPSATVAHNNDGPDPSIAIVQPY
jgi:hypothetical protein